MADASRYEFNFEEMATALVRHLNIHDGLWTLGFGFHFNAKNLGADNNPKVLRPGFLGVINNVSLIRVNEALPGLTIDAAQVNPRMVVPSEPRRKSH